MAGFQVTTEGIDEVVPERAPFFERRGDGSLRIVIVAIDSLFAGEAATISFKTDFKLFEKQPLWGRDFGYKGHGNPPKETARIEAWRKEDPLRRELGVKFVSEMNFIEAISANIRSLPMKNN